jgi:outer membrane protein assembly factor BamB
MHLLDTAKFFGRALLGLSLMGIGVVASADESDWPQWRGTNRDGHAGPQQLMDQWPEGGPAVKWVFRDAGQGYSECSVANGRVFTMGARGDQCFVMCLSADNGEAIWETAISRASTDDDYTHNWGGGPRSTPTVDGDYLYANSDIGTVACLKVSDGTVVWSVNLVEKFGGSIPTWGYSDSVLVDGDRVIATPGGENFLVGLDKRTGEQVWNTKGFNAEAQYVSVIRHDFLNQGLYLTASKTGFYAINADSGEAILTSPVTGNNVAVIPTPVAQDDLVYHTSDYGAGNALWKLSRNADGVGGELVYHLQNKTMRNHHGGVVLVDGTIFGFTKANRGQWMAQDFASGEVLWSESLGSNASGSIAYADGMLYCYGDKDGSVHLVAPSRDELQVKGTLTLPQQTEIPRKSGAIWAHPVVANQMLIIRDQNLIYAFDIAAK